MTQHETRAKHMSASYLLFEAQECAKARYGVALLVGAILFLLVLLSGMILVAGAPPR